MGIYICYAQIKCHRMNMFQKDDMEVEVDLSGKLYYQVVTQVAEV
jgi:hypothetical protein